MLEVSGELSRVATEWRLSHPEDVVDEVSATGRYSQHAYLFRR